MFMAVSLKPLTHPKEQGVLMALLGVYMALLGVFMALLARLGTQ